jgi:hypothetical protein
VKNEFMRGKYFDKEGLFNSKTRRKEATNGKVNSSRTGFD